MTEVAASQGTEHEATDPPAARQEAHAGTLPASSSACTDATRVGEAAAQPASTRLPAICAGVGVDAGEFGLQLARYTVVARTAHVMATATPISAARFTTRPARALR